MNLKLIRVLAVTPWLAMVLILLFGMSRHGNTSESPMRVKKRFAVRDEVLASRANIKGNGAGKDQLSGSDSLNPNVPGLAVPFSTALHFLPAPPPSRIAVDASQIEEVLSLAPETVYKLNQALVEGRNFLKSQDKPYSEQVTLQVIDLLRTRYSKVLSQPQLSIALYLSVPRDWTKQDRDLSLFESP